jgi:hypothetical protein
VNEAPGEDSEEQVEVLDGLPVLAEARPLEPLRAGGILATQSAALAATGFVAGAATAVVLAHRRTRKAEKRRRRKGRRDLLDVVGSRSFLVDVHLLGGRD